MRPRNARSCFELGLDHRHFSTFTSFLFVLSLFTLNVVDGRNPCKKLYRTELPFHCTTAACVSCPAGFGVAKFCNGSIPTVCKACVAGISFSNNSNPYDKCETVSRCGLNRVVGTPASNISDVRCVCRPGYEPSELDCVKKLPITEVLYLKSEYSQTVASTSSQLPASNQRQTKLILNSGVLNSETSTVYDVVTSTSASGYSIVTSTYVEDNVTSVIYIVLGVCLSIVVVITIVVVFVACYYYRVDKYCRRWNRVKHEDDEEHLIGQSNGNCRSVRHACVGLQYTLTADIAFAWLPWKKYNWTKNNIPLKRHSHMTISNTSITFKDIQPADAGEYCCRNESGDKQTTIQFVVEENLLPNYRVDEGMPLVLKYVIHGGDTGCDWSYQWYCDGLQLHSTRRDWSGENTTELAIYRVSGRKRYWCVAKSDEWQLKIQSATAVVASNGIQSSNTDFTPTNDAVEILYANYGMADHKLEVKVEINDESAATTASYPGMIQATEDHPQHLSEVMMQPSEQNGAKSGHNTLGKTFSCVKHLTAEILDHLARDIEETNDESSVLAIAESVGIDVENVKDRAAVSKDSARFMLERLHEIDPNYPLSALCHILVENNRPECALRLCDHVERAGGILRLPNCLLTQLSSCNQWNEKSNG